MRVGAARFVAGETLDECVAVIRRLNAAGMHANTTLLGEAILDPAGAAAVTQEYERILDRLAAEGLRTNVALKLTHLGLSFDAETAYENVERLVARAADLGSFIRIDMEQSEHLDATLEIYERLRAAGHDTVGTALQSYLYRTPDDLERLLPFAPNLRIVKGAYLEPAEIAYPEKKDVDRAYVELVERGLRGGAYVAVATHDEAMIEHVKAFAEREGIDARPIRVPDALRRTARASALDRGRGLQDAGRDAVRARLVPVPHAQARRAPGEPWILRRGASFDGDARFPSAQMSSSSVAAR